MESLQQFLDTAWNWFLTQGYKIIVAIVLLFICFTIINSLSKTIKKICIKRDFDKTLGKTLRYVFRLGLKILVVIALMSYVGIDTSSITALIAATGLGVGLAIQGSLSNVAGGFLIIMLRPFRVDDYIEAMGKEGTVEEIRLIYTYIKTFDNTVICLPNGPLANSTITNYTEKTSRRVDHNFAISYDADYKKAQEIILGVAENHNLVKKTPEPVCRISEHTDSTIVLCAKFWVNTEDYWTVYFDMLEQIKDEFDKAGISHPFNKVDIHIDNAGKIEQKDI